MTDTDYVDDLALLVNKSTQAESLLHGLEQAARSIGLNVNLDKKEFMYFKQVGDISILNGKSLRLADQFT